jgi:esterase/lipase superfamily enzyme
MDLFRREIHSWYSHRLGMEMPLVQYGHWGHPLLLYPTAGADYLEYERYELIPCIAPYIIEGKCRVFSINSVNNQSWMNKEMPFADRSARQAAYSGYVEEEVVPYIRDQVKDGGARVAACGASFGAFHAANQVFRRPDLFDCLLGLSGFYDLAWLLDGYSDDRVYFNNPMWYVANIGDGEQLEALRHRCQIHLITGQGAWEVPNASRRFSALLASKGINHNLDLWGFDVPHDWPSWKRMLPHYIGERLGW